MPVLYLEHTLIPKQNGIEYKQEPFTRTADNYVGFLKKLAIITPLTRDTCLYGERYMPSKSNAVPRSWMPLAAAHTAPAYTKQTLSKNNNSLPQQGLYAGPTISTCYKKTVDCPHNYIQQPRFIVRYYSFGSSVHHNSDKLYISVMLSLYLL